jgi:hypothetical protein
MPRDRWLGPWVIAGLVLLLRLPFLTPGYGIDPDAWRIAADGRAIAETGAYASSRAPGNPIPELAAALLWRGGPLALNGVTALFSAVAVAIFALTLRRLGVRDAMLGALALGFTPVIAVNSANAMDYVWALAFLLIAHDAALRGRAIEAGVLLGLAAGCRITSLLIAPALIVILIDRELGPARASRAIRFVLTLAVISFAAFLPALITYGPRFLHAYGSGYPPPLYVLKNATVDVWGLIGCAALGIAAGAALARRATPAMPRVSRTWVFAWVLAVALELAAFLALPHQAEYLIPVVPFVLLLAACALTPRVFRVLALALIASSLALKASELGKPDSPSVSAAAVRLGSGRLVLDLRGPLLIEHDRRQRGVEYVDRVIARGATLPPGSVVSAYEWLPFLKVRLGGTRQGGVEYVHVLDRAEIDRHRAAGDSLYDLPGAEDESVRINGIGLHALGSRPLGMEEGP